jgi:hypothetical protein
MESRGNLTIQGADMAPEKNTKIAQMKRALRHIEALAEILAEPAVPSVQTLIVEEMAALLHQVMPRYPDLSPDDT